MHDRMPVIVVPKDYDRWLEPAEANALPLDLLRPFPAERTKAWKANTGSCDLIPLSFASRARRGKPT
jgi:putative SOS response-associated peptidase YedK